MPSRLIRTRRSAPPPPAETRPGRTGPVLVGKIPDRADFVRRGDPSPALDALDALSQRALRSKPSKTGPRYRLIAAPGGPHAVVGALQLSRDAVGRAYPLVVGRTVPSDALDPDASAAWPLRWSTLLDASAQLIEDALGGATLDTLDARLATLPDLAPAHGRSDDVDTHVRAIEALPAQALWTRIWGAPNPSRAAFILRRLAVAPRRPVSYGLRFPLPPPAPDFRPSDAVAVWLAVCWHLLPTPDAAPTLFWTDGPPGALYVFYRDLAVPAFRSILTGSIDTDRIARVDDGAQAALYRSATALPASFRQLLGDRRASVADVLARLHTLR